MERIGVLPWNAQGIRGKKEEIVEMFNIKKLSILTTQETKLPEYNNFNLPNYNIIRKNGTFNVTAHGGVSLFIHSSIPYNVININTPIQAVTAQVRLHTTITIYNVYIPRSQESFGQYLPTVATTLSSIERF